MTLSITTPIISGITQEESPDTATATSSAGSTITWQWYKSLVLAGPYVAISGATSSTYMVQEGDDTAHLEVIATATDGLGNQVSATSAVTAKVHDEPDNQPMVSITGSVKVGGVLKAVVVDANDDYTYSRLFEASADNGLTWSTVSTNGSINVTAALFNDLIRFTATGTGVHHIGFNGTATVGPVTAAAVKFSQIGAGMGHTNGTENMTVNHTSHVGMFALFATR